MNLYKYKREYGCHECKIHEGAEVRIEEKKDKWYKVYVYVDVEDLRGDEDKKEVEFKIGWIPEAEVGKI